MRRACPAARKGALVALFGLFASTAHAACVLPYTFGLSPYTVAQSAQVNANFQALAACIGAQGGGGGGGSGTVNTGAPPAVAQYQAAGTTVAPATISGDATLAVGGALTVTKSSGIPFLGMAFQAPGAVAITGGTFRGLATPTQPTDAATKAYVDSSFTGSINAGSAPQIAQYQGAGSILGGATIGGDATLAAGGALTVTKSNGSLISGMAFQAPSAVAITGGSFTGLGTPVNPTDAANKNYVDSALSGQVVWHNPPVSYATAAVLPNAPTYNNGAGTLTDSSAGAVLVVDGQSGANTLGTSILVQNQAAPAQNGIYTVTTSGVAGVTPWVLTRRSDFNMVMPGEIALGASVLVTVGGTTYIAGSAFVMNQTTTPIVLGTTAITWAQNSAGNGSITASLPITSIANNIAFQAIPATSLPANTGVGSAPPSGSVGYGTGPNQLLQLNSNALVPAANLPAGGGGGSSGPSITAFYVAPGGSDAAAGTIAAPFATISHAITASATSSIKTIYVRAGTYNVASSGSSCFSNLYGLGVTAGNEGLTISYWPPDGLNTAVINGSNATSIGLCIFNGGNGVSVIGLKFTNWVNTAVRIAGGSGTGQGATGVTVSDNVITGTTGTFGGGIELIGNTQGAKILRNDIETINTQGIKWTDSGSGNGGGTGIDIEYNFLRNTCIGFSDCGSIYLQNIQCALATCSTGILIEHNYMTGVVAGSYGIYLDDWASYVTSEYNTIFLGSSNSATPDCAFVHGGQNNVFKYNICDLGGNGGAMTNAGGLIQQNSTHGTPVMTGNVFQDNIIVCKSSSAPCGGGYKTFAPTPANPANIANNLYWNFTTQTGGVSGVANTAGTGATVDSNPTGGNPQIRCYAGVVDQSGPAANAPVFFLGGGNYAWGPQSPALGNANIPFYLPHTGQTPPSWTSTC